MPIATPSPQIGHEVRRWRELRSLSQLGLASRADVSTRHLSFVETGRAQPTAEMILRLATAMDVPLPEQNQLLLAGGFAPKHAQRTAADETLAPVMAGLRNLLDAHAPYPALLLDDDWDVVDANAPVNQLIADCAPELLEPPINVIRLCLHPNGLAPQIRNLDAWRAHLLHQLDQRIERTGQRSSLVELRDEVSAYPHGAKSAPAPADPVAYLDIRVGGADLRMFSVVSQIESPADITLSGLHLETFVPADTATREILAR